MLSGNALHRHDKQGKSVFINLPEEICWQGTIILMRIPVDIDSDFDYRIYIKWKGIMVKVLKIKELISADVRSRANAKKIWDIVNATNNSIELDFSGVIFVSRSFADEVYNIIDSKKGITITNTFDIVKSMFETVSSSRSSKRVREKDNSEIKDFHDMESLSSFLSTM